MMALVLLLTTIAESKWYKQIVSFPAVYAHPQHGSLAVSTIHTGRANFPVPILQAIGAGEMKVWPVRLTSRLAPWYTEVRSLSVKTKTGLFQAHNLPAIPTYLQFAIVGTVANTAICQSTKQP